MTLYNFVEASCYQLQVGHKKQEESIQWLNSARGKKETINLQRYFTRCYSILSRAGSLFCCPFDNYPRLF